MENTKNYTFEVSLSNQNFTHKPDRATEIPKLTFSQTTTTIDEFADAITQGFCYTPVYSLSTFSMANKTDANYVYSSFVSLDFDHSKTSMSNMVEALEYKPTIAYTSCNNGLNDEYRFRFIYCFNEPIEGLAAYSAYVLTLLKANNLSIKDIDQRSLKGSQYYNGNGCGDVNIIITHNIYNREDFKDYYGTYTESIIQNNNTPTPTIMWWNDTFSSKQFIDDYWNMRMEDVLCKYVETYPNIDHTPMDEADEDTPYILFPADYIEIRRYWTTQNEGKAIKLKDGQGRRRKLFLNGIIRRLINPSITLENLLYNLLFELVHYVSNYQAKNIIGKKEIYQIACNVMRADLEAYECLRGTERTYMVNPKYCVKYGINKRQARNIAEKAIRSEHIGELFDYNKTDKENLEAMKEHGLRISLITLKRWRLENGITKYQKNK